MNAQCYYMKLAAKVVTVHYGVTNFSNKASVTKSDSVPD